MKSQLSEAECVLLADKELSSKLDGSVHVHAAGQDRSGTAVDGEVHGTFGVSTE